jgi:hypothetical protein
VPFLYYGEEIGMVGSGDHLNIRTPMQWTSGTNAGFTTGTPWNYISSNYTDYNVADEAGDPGSLLEWYKRLIRVRNASPALRQGTYEPLETSHSSVMAFVRKDEQQTLLSLINTSPSSRGGITLTGNAASLEPGEHTLVNLLQDGDTLQVTVTPDHEIAGLSLDGREVALYDFAESSGVGPGGEPTRTGLHLERSYPNPFARSTTIRYSLPGRAHVRLGVYDVVGREVAILRDTEQGQGSHEVKWDGSDRGGRDLAAGVYLVHLDAGGEARTSKVMLMR